MVHTTRSDWLVRYPDTLVLDWYPEFAARSWEIKPGRPGLGSQFQQTTLHWDSRLAENELILGFNVGPDFWAYVLDDFGPGFTVLNDQLGGWPIVVFLQPEKLRPRLLRGAGWAGFGLQT